MIDSWLDPTPTYSFGELPLDDRHLVVLELAVQAGPSLYSSGKPNGNKQIYVRHHSTSVQARAGEIEEICRSRNVARTYGH